MEKRYREWIHVSKGFKSVVNIVNDRDNPDEVNSYIPTLFFRELLEGLVQKLSDDGERKPILLTGTYGTGKSHTLLTVSHMLSNELDGEFLCGVMERLEGSWGTTARNWRGFREKYRFLPVVLTGYGKFNDLLIQNLNKTLDRFGLGDLKQETEFSQALQRIDQLLHDGKFIQIKNEIEKRLVPLGIESLVDLERSLENYHARALEEFTRVHKELLGVGFMDQQNDYDVKQIYTTVAKKIRSQGFEGIVVIWDEFSGFLNHIAMHRGSVESQRLQDFAEACDVKDAKVLPIFVSHLAMEEYGHAHLADSDVKSDLSKISARFERRTMHLENLYTYRLLSRVMIRENGFNQLRDTLPPSHDEMVGFLEELLVQRLGLDASRYDVFDIESGLFPLHPFTIPVLPRISEKVAQNERTVFTFLNDSHRWSNELGTMAYGFGAFLEENGFEASGAQLYGPEQLFDYFTDAMRADPNHQDVAPKVEYFRQLSGNLPREEIRVLKVIALLDALNDHILNASMEMIKKAFAFSDLKPLDVERIVYKLKQKGLVFSFGDAYRLSTGNAEKVNEDHRKLKERYLSRRELPLEELLPELSEFSDSYSLEQPRAGNTRSVDVHWFAPRDFRKRYPEKLRPDLDAEPGHLQLIFQVDFDRGGSELLQDLDSKPFPPHHVFAAMEGTLHHDLLEQMADYLAWKNLATEYPEYDRTEERQDFNNRAESAKKKLGEDVKKFLQSCQVELMYRGEGELRKQTVHFQDLKGGSVLVRLLGEVYSKTPRIVDTNLWKETQASNIKRTGALILECADASLLVQPNEDEKGDVKRTLKNFIFFPALYTQKDGTCFLHPSPTASEELRNVVHMVEDAVKETEEPFELQSLAETLMEAPYGLSRNLVFLLFCYAFHPYSTRDQVLVLDGGKQKQVMNSTVLADVLNDVVRKGKGKYSFSIVTSDFKEVLKEVFAAPQGTPSAIISTIRNWYSQLPVNPLAVVDQMEGPAKRFQELVLHYVMQDAAGEHGREFIDQVGLFLVENGAGDPMLARQKLDEIKQTWEEAAVEIAARLFRDQFELAFPKESFEEKWEMFTASQSLEQEHKVLEGFDGLEWGKPMAVCEVAKDFVSMNPKMWGNDVFAEFFQNLREKLQQVESARYTHFMEKLEAFVDREWGVNFRKYFDHFQNNKSEYSTWFGEYTHLLEALLNEEAPLVWSVFQRDFQMDPNTVTFQKKSPGMSFSIGLKTKFQMVVQVDQKKAATRLQLLVWKVFEPDPARWFATYGVHDSEQHSWERKVVEKAVARQKTLEWASEMVHPVLEGFGKDLLDMDDAFFLVLEKELSDYRQRVENHQFRALEKQVDELFGALFPVEKEGRLFLHLLERFSQELKDVGEGWEVQLLLKSNLEGTLEKVFGKPLAYIEPREVVPRVQPAVEAFLARATRLFHDKVLENAKLMLNRVLEGDYRSWWQAQKQEPQRFADWVQDKVGPDWERLFNVEAEDREGFLKGLGVLAKQSPLAVLDGALNPLEQELRGRKRRLEMERHPLEREQVVSRLSLTEISGLLQNHGLVEQEEVASALFYFIGEMDESGRNLLKKWLFALSPEEGS